MRHLFEWAILAENRWALIGRKLTTMMGVDPVQALVAMRELGAVALGANCGNGPSEIEGVIKAMRAADPTVKLVAKANAGVPEYVAGALTYRGTLEVMARHALRVRSLGATIIGACCGSTPDHVRAMAEALASVQAEAAGGGEQSAPSETQR